MTFGRSNGLVTTLSGQWLTVEQPATDELKVGASIRWTPRMVACRAFDLLSRDSYDQGDEQDFTLLTLRCGGPQGCCRARREEPSGSTSLVKRPDTVGKLFGACVWETMSCRSILGTLAKAWKTVSHSQSIVDKQRRIALIKEPNALCEIQSQAAVRDVDSSGATRALSRHHDNIR